jgi:hypothetical protein
MADFITLPEHKMMFLPSTGFQLRTLHQDSDMMVQQLVVSDTPQVVPDLPIGPEKCYHAVPGRTSHLMTWAMIQPITFLNPQRRDHDGQAWDFGVNAYLAHGNCVTDEMNVPVAPIELRRARPDLELFWRLPDLVPQMSQVPVLGLAFGPSQWEAAAQDTMQGFRQRCEQQALDHFGMHHWCECVFMDMDVCGMIDGGPNAVGKLRKFLARDMIDHSSSLSTAACAALLPVLDLQAERHRVMAQVARSWLENSGIMRMANKLSPGSAVLLLYVLTRDIMVKYMRLLDAAIMETKKNAA